MEAISNIVDNVVTVTPSLAGLRAARDEAQRNFELISADVGAAEEDLNLQINALRRQFEEKYSDLLALQKRAHDIANRAEVDLRTAVIESFLATGNKQVDKDLKLSVRVNRKVSIADQIAALAWAKVAMPALVVEHVDEKKFAKIADTLWDEAEMPGWVTVDSKPSAVIGELT